MRASADPSHGGLHDPHSAQPALPVQASLRVPRPGKAAAPSGLPGPAVTAGGWQARITRHRGVKTGSAMVGADDRVQQADCMRCVGSSGLLLAQEEQARSTSEIRIAAWGRMSTSM